MGFVIFLSLKILILTQIISNNTNFIFENPKQEINSKNIKNVFNWC